MDQLINAALDARWQMIQPGLNLSTPDSASGSPFSISAVNNVAVNISTAGGTPITLHRHAFVETLRYLLFNQYTDKNPVPNRIKQTYQSSRPSLRCRTQCERRQYYDN